MHERLLDVIRKKRAVTSYAMRRDDPVCGCFGNKLIAVVANHPYNSILVSSFLA